MLIFGFPIRPKQWNPSDPNYFGEFPCCNATIEPIQPWGILHPWEKYHRLSSPHHSQLEWGRPVEIFPDRRIFFLTRKPCGRQPTRAPSPRCPPSHWAGAPHPDDGDDDDDHIGQGHHVLTDQWFVNEEIKLEYVAKTNIGQGHHILTNQWFVNEEIKLKYVAKKNTDIFLGGILQHRLYGDRHLCNLRYIWFNALCNICYLWYLL